MLLPLSFDLTDRKIILIGGGKAALEKFTQLRQTACDLTVISPEFDAVLAQGLDSPQTARITVLRRKFTPADIDGAFMVFSAVDDVAVAEEIFRLCRAQKILINSADDKARCDFFTTAPINRGHIQVSVSTQGRFAGVSAVLRRHLDRLLPEELDAEWEKIFALRERALTLQSVIEKKSVITDIVRAIEERYFAVNDRENE